MSLTGREFEGLAKDRMVVRGIIYATSTACFLVEAHLATIAEGLLVEVDYSYKVVHHTIDCVGTVSCSDQKKNVPNLLIEWRGSRPSFLCEDEVLVILYPYDRKEDARRASPSDWRFLQTTALCYKKLCDVWISQSGLDTSSDIAERKALEKAVSRLGAFLREQNRKVAEALATLSGPG